VNALDILFTHHFRVLVLMHDYQVIIGNDKFSKITQVEIGEQLELSKVTINHIVKDLTENGFVTRDEGRIGKYYLSKEAEDIVEKFKRTK